MTTAISTSDPGTERVGDRFGCVMRTSPLQLNKERTGRSGMSQRACSRFHQAARYLRPSCADLPFLGLLCLEIGIRVLILPGRIMALGGPDPALSRMSDLDTSWPASGPAESLKSFGRRKRTKVADERTRGEQVAAMGNLLLG